MSLPGCAHWPLRWPLELIHASVLAGPPPVEAVGCRRGLAVVRDRASSVIEDGYTQCQERRRASRRAARALRRSSMASWWISARDWFLVSIRTELPVRGALRSETACEVSIGDGFSDELVPSGSRSEA